MREKRTTPQEAVQALNGAAQQLREAINSRGGAAKETDGLRGLTERVGDLVRPRGKETRYRVSKRGNVFHGDALTVCRELSVGTTLEFVSDGAEIVEAITDVLTGISAILYIQGGATKLKLFRCEGETILLGNTVVIAEEEELTEAAMAIVPKGHQLYILYNLDGDGQMIAVKYTNAMQTTVTWTDIWMDGSDPANIVAEYHPKYAMVVIGCTRLREGATQDEEREAVILFAAVNGTPDVNIASLGQETVLTAEAYPALHGMDYAKDAYAQGWALACYGDTLYLTYPKRNETGRGIVMAAGSWTQGQYAYTPLGFGDCPIMGSIPSAAVSANDVWSEDVAGCALLAHGVTRLAKGKIESLLGLELWVRQADGARPTLLWMGEEDVKYATNISRVCIGPMDTWGGYAGYSHGNTMWAMAVERHGNTAVGGPPATVGEFDGFAKIIPAQPGAVLVYQRNGAGYIRQLRSERVVTRAKLGHADAEAIDSGKVGDTIRVVMRE